jgi:hypothetical protein
MMRHPAATALASYGEGPVSEQRRLGPAGTCAMGQMCRLNRLRGCRGARLRIRFSAPPAAWSTSLGQGGTTHG